MTLDDYARLYTLRAATLTMARHISPRLGWCVRNPANTNSRAALSPVRAAGVDADPPSTPNPISALVHAAPVKPVQEGLL